MSRKPAKQRGPTPGEVPQEGNAHDPTADPYTDQDRMDVYKQLCQQIQDGKLKNAEQFDKAILTLSSGALVVSMAFIKDIVPVSRLVWTPALLVSWILFASSMLSTMFSFISSQRAHDVQSDNLEAYFLRNEEDACNRPNRYTTLTIGLNGFSALSFTLAIVITIAFVWKNLSGEQRFKNHPTLNLQEKARMEDTNLTPNPSPQTPVQVSPSDYQTAKLVPESDDGLGAIPPGIPKMPPPKEALDISKTMPSTNKGTRGK